MDGLKCPLEKNVFLFETELLLGLEQVLFGYSNHRSDRVWAACVGPPLLEGRIIALQPTNIICAGLEARLLSVVLKQRRGSNFWQQALLGNQTPSREAYIDSRK